MRQEWKGPRDPGAFFNERKNKNTLVPTILCQLYNQEKCSYVCIKVQEMITATRFLL